MLNCDIYLNQAAKRNTAITYKFHIPQKKTRIAERKLQIRYNDVFTTLVQSSKNAQTMVKIDPATYLQS